MSSGPVERPRAGVVAARVRRAHRRRRAAARRGSASSERAARPACRLRARAASCSARSPPARRRRSLRPWRPCATRRPAPGTRARPERAACTHAPSTATLPIGRPSDERMPFSQGDPRGRDARDVERPRVREPRLAVQDDQPAGPDRARGPAATAATARRRRARRSRAPCSGGESASLVPAQERRDRRAAPLGRELGKALHPEAGAGERLGEDLRREHDPFAAAADEQHLLHLDLSSPPRLSGGHPGDRRGPLRSPDRRGQLLPSADARARPLVLDASPQRRRRSGSSS